MLFVIIGAPSTNIDPGFCICLQITRLLREFFSYAIPIALIIAVFALLLPNERGNERLIGNRPAVRFIRDGIEILQRPDISFARAKIVADLLDGRLTDPVLGQADVFGFVRHHFQAACPSQCRCPLPDINRG